ncbi:MAG: CRISPR-associated endonuclease Cas3'' [Firmicutes bacterium]|nr:CRISPR-associated endonuclease Cas3'' [Bacillota bacterium]
MVGLLHDLGKCHLQFQEYLEVICQGKRCEKVPHSPWGAVFVNHYKQLSSELRCLLGLIVYSHRGIS